MALALIDPLSKLKEGNFGYWPVNISSLENVPDEDLHRFVLGEYATFVASGTTATTRYVSDYYNDSRLTNCDLMINRLLERQPYWNSFFF